MVRLHIDPDMKMDLKIAGGSFYCAVPGVAHKSQQFSRLYGIPLLPLPAVAVQMGVIEIGASRSTDSDPPPAFLQPCLLYTSGKVLP